MLSLLHTCMCVCVCVCLYYIGHPYKNVKETTHSGCLLGREMGGEFTGGPVVRTLSSHCQGCGFNPRLGK